MCMNNPNNIVLEPVAFVRNNRSEIKDDDWGAVVSEIVLADHFSAEVLLGLDAFSHIEVIFHFDRVTEHKINTGKRRPRSNPDWPEVGIFAQRGKNRPNRLGLCTAEILRVEDRKVVVKGLDAIDGTPVLDIKPVMEAFLPRKKVVAPSWSSELMQHYWHSEDKP